MGYQDNLDLKALTLKLRGLMESKVFLELQESLDFLELLDYLVMKETQFCHKIDGSIRVKLVHLDILEGLEMIFT